MKHYTSTEIKELTDFAVVGNIHTNVCSLTLFNEDENGVESDTVVIELTQKKLRSLITMLQTYLKPGEEE